jgi:hypothetical protein
MGNTPLAPEIERLTRATGIQETDDADHGGPADRTGETIDHVGFRIADHDRVRRKLDGLGISYSRMELPELGERRLFIRTPTGILLELVFRETKTGSPSTHQEQTNDQ